MMGGWYFKIQVKLTAVKLHRPHAFSIAISFLVNMLNQDLNTTIFHFYWQVIDDEVLPNNTSFVKNTEKMSHENVPCNTNCVDIQLQKKYYGIPLIYYNYMRMKHLSLQKYLPYFLHLLWAYILNKTSHVYQVSICGGKRVTIWSTIEQLDWLCSPFSILFFYWLIWLYHISNFYCSSAASL